MRKIFEVTYKVIGGTILLCIVPFVVIGAVIIELLLQVRDLVLGK